MKMTSKIGLLRPLFFALCVCLLACAGIAPTTLSHMSVAKLTRVSSLILRARCVENYTAWDAGEIWTFTTYEPTEVWKGSAQARVRVRLLGGRLGNLTSNVSGVPRFRAGEDVVLFLAPTTRGDFSVVSWVQGTFRIRHDQRTGEDRVTQDSASFDTFDPSTRQFTASGIRDLPLQEFRWQVAAALRQE
ncbi:MAG: hypothetical protein ABSB66_00910 [Candidatus Acidiferrales bacterium]|jgi:hypothetical protein